MHLQKFCVCVILATVVSGWQFGLALFFGAALSLIVQLRNGHMSVV